MKMINIFKTFVMLMGIVVFQSSCKKLDLAPKDRFSELNFWQVDANVNNALNNVYNSIYTSTNVFYNEAMSDNAVSKLDVNTGANTIGNGNFTIDLARFRNDWAFYYSGIKSCNLFLENIDKNTTLPMSTKNRMLGEVKFARAWHHFNLMKWWGAIPLLNKDITPEQAQIIARNPKADVLAFILSELDAAAVALPSRDQYAINDNGRITKGAALALKARVLLYEGNRMAEVATVCEALINNQSANGNYSLAASFCDLFSDKTINKTNNESILSLQYVPNLRMWGDYFDFAPISEGARTNNLSPTQELVDSYIMLNGKAINDAGSGYADTALSVNRDPRLSATIVYDKYLWTKPNGTSVTIYIKPGSTIAPAPNSNEFSTSGQGTATGYYWRKYWDPNYVGTLNNGTNIHLIRYAEVLLMYAEAKQTLGQLDATVWDKTIKVLRTRAGFTEATALNFPGTLNLQNIVRNERRSELAMEGFRIDDIRRWNIAQIVLNGWMHGAKYGDVGVDNGFIRAQFRNFDPTKNFLWPIPPSERALNPNLTQNPNY